MNDEQKRYGGFTVGELKQCIEHSEANEESIDYITGDDANSANIIKDLLADLAASASAEPIYQSKTTTGWMDVSEEHYDLVLEQCRRIVYTAPRPIEAPDNPQPVIDDKTVTVPPFDDERVQIVYGLICDTDTLPPEGEHWDGFVSRRIVAALELHAKPVALTDAQHLEFTDVVAKELWLVWGTVAPQSWEKVANKEKYRYPARKAIEVILGWKPRSEWQIAWADMKDLESICQVCPNPVMCEEANKCARKS